MSARVVVVVESRVLSPHLSSKKRALTTSLLLSSSKFHYQHYTWIILITYLINHHKFPIPNHSRCCHHEFYYHPHKFSLCLRVFFLIPIPNLQNNFIWRPKQQRMKCKTPTCPFPQRLPQVKWKILWPLLGIFTRIFVHLHSLFFSSSFFFVFF